MTDEADQVKEFLREKDGRLHHRENQELEFKEQFNFSGLAEYLRDFAAFANNRGVILRLKCTTNLRIKVYHFDDGKHHQNGTKTSNRGLKSSRMERSQDRQRTRVAPQHGEAVWRQSRGCTPADLCAAASEAALVCMECEPAASQGRGAGSLCSDGGAV